MALASRPLGSQPLASDVPSGAPPATTEVYAGQGNAFQFFQYIGGGGGGPTAYDLTATAGALTFAGVSAGLNVARSLTGTAGAIRLSGVAAALNVARKLNATAGAITYTGATAALNIARSLGAVPGSITLTGVSAALNVARSLPGTAGSIVYTGGTATLDYTPSGGGTTYTLDGAAGSITYTGAAASFVRALTLTAQPGVIQYQGADATFALTQPDAGGWRGHGGEWRQRVGDDPWLQPLPERVERAIEQVARDTTPEEAPAALEARIERSGLEFKPDYLRLLQELQARDADTLDDLRDEIAREIAAQRMQEAVRVGLLRQRSNDDAIALLLLLH